MLFAEVKVLHVLWRPGHPHVSDSVAMVAAPVSGGGVRSKSYVRYTDVLRPYFLRDLAVGLCDGVDMDAPKSEKTQKFVSLVLVPNLSR